MGDFGERAKRWFFLAMGWLFGILFILLGVGALTGTMWLVGLVSVGGAAFILPPVRSWATSKTGIRLPENVRIGGYVALVIAFAVTTAIDSGRVNRAEAERAAKERMEQAAAAEAAMQEEWVHGRDSILSAVRASLAAEQYREAAKIAHEYLFSEDKTLRGLHREAVDAIEAADNKALEERIVEELKRIPASDVRENRNRYRKLTELAPDNARYQDRYEHYQRLVDAEEARKAARLAAWGNPPEQSSWDGSYRPVKDYLKEVMHDPSSLDMDGCTPVYAVEGRGWIVGCDYRGKNAFGGVIRQSNWFVIRHNVVLSMEEPDAFSFR